MVGGLTPVGKVPPMLTVVPDLSVSLPADGPSSLIGQIVREGARQMLAAALRAEVAAYTDQFAGVRGEDGRRLVVRNRSAGPRTVLTSAGAVGVTAPRVNDKRTDPESGQRMRFSSAILPPWARKTPRVSEVLPLLYLHGLSSGDFVPALGQFLGTGAGLSSSTVTKLTGTWKAEAAAFMTRDLSQVDYVYLWVDGIHLGIPLEEDKLCLLVMIGGALGFWKAAREVFPQARTQRCWFHKIVDVLGALPESAHPGAKKALAEIWNAEDKDHARAAVKAFPATYGAKFPRPRPRSPAMRKNCRRSTTTRPSTGCTCARPTRSSRPSPRCGCGRRSPRGTGRRPPDDPRPEMTPGHRNRLHVQRHEATKLEDPCGRCSRS